MSVKEKAQRLFEYISKVLAIDLPVIRDVKDHRAELWWLASLPDSPYCLVRPFDVGQENGEDDVGEGEDAWLSVAKHPLDPPPQLPAVLDGWAKVLPDPTKKPIRTASVLRPVTFECDPQRTQAFATYSEQWVSLKNEAAVPAALDGWLDPNGGSNIPPACVAAIEEEERFEDNAAREVAFNQYCECQWQNWSQRVFPVFRSNGLYDELYALHQRLSVEADRIEIICGHLFLAWEAENEPRINYPLILTPLTLRFDPDQRRITLAPAESQLTRVDLDCLRDLGLPDQDALQKLAININSAETPPNAWNHNNVRGLGAHISGYLSNMAAEETNRYADAPVAEPKVTRDPTVHNAPVIFVRQRVRQFWIDDAREVAKQISSGVELPPFVRSLVADYENNEELGAEVDCSPAEPDDDGEMFFPKEYNEQQKEIWERLRTRFGVLVQGPPGTGKTHTIANIVCSCLSRGGRVLVTSQTENALRTLRQLIPEEIRSLCVSQLGNDTESKTQLKESIREIGRLLIEKGSSAPEERVGRIKADLRAAREEQARLHHAIRAWAELASTTITIDGQQLTAQQAAEECDAGSEHGWLPDAVAPEVEPPITNAELQELCALFAEVSAEHQEACLQSLPELSQIQTPQEVAQMVAARSAAAGQAAQSEQARLQWGTQLRIAERDRLDKVAGIVESALASLNDIEDEWQLRLLGLTVSDSLQRNFWQKLYQELDSLYQRAFGYHQKTHGHEILLGAMPSDFEMGEALLEIKGRISKGKNPSSFWGRLGLSQPARFLLQSATVDGRKLTTLDRVEFVQDHFSYWECLRKFEIRWRQVAQNVGGPLAASDAPMVLADIGRRLKDFGQVIRWIEDHYDRVRDELLGLGCPPHHQQFHKGMSLAEHLDALQGQLAAIEAQRVIQSLQELRQHLARASQEPNPHALWKELAAALEDASAENYAKSYQQLLTLTQIRPKALRLERLFKELQAAAPVWACLLQAGARQSGVAALPEDWETAWRWRCLDTWLSQMHARESVEDLQNKMERARTKERELIAHLVVERTRQRQIAKVEDAEYLALTAWALEMDAYGRGTGRHAPRHLAAANKAMVKAVGAVPVWIMPLFRVVQAFQAKAGIFDLVIVDEASQCDIRALPVLFRAKKVLIVGDPEQISPAKVGLDQGKVNSLNKDLLAEVPYRERFDVTKSLYAMAGTIPHMTRTLLTEHFRCLPAIIEFNNHLCPSYGGSLEPLRQPNPQELLHPAIQCELVTSGFKDGNNVNKPEAEALVKRVVECCRDDRYAQGGKGKQGKRTMGVISLLGEGQAKYISDFIAHHSGLDEREREERRIIVGDAYAFQGDERDVMFLSMVIAPNAAFSAQVKEDARQRFNVATSRARDQVFLFHSVQLADLNNPDCMRHKLLQWYLNPPLAEMQAGLERLRQTAESPFEIEVGTRIINKGYKVIPQFKPFPRDFNYRIDLVVQGENSRVAVECDGDRWHGPERWEDDQRREAQLRRADWNFWRISGSSFYRDKERALNGLWQFLEEAGIRPTVA